MIISKKENYVKEKEVINIENTNGISNSKLIFRKDNDNCIK